MCVCVCVRVCACVCVYIYIFINLTKKIQFRVFIMNLFHVVMTFFRWSLIHLCLGYDVDFPTWFRGRRYKKTYRFPDKISLYFNV